MSSGRAAEARAPAMLAERDRASRLGRGPRTLLDRWRVRSLPPAWRRGALASVVSAGGQSPRPATGARRSSAERRGPTLTAPSSAHVRHAAGRAFLRASVALRPGRGAHRGRGLRRRRTTPRDARRPDRSTDVRPARVPRPSLHAGVPPAIDWHFDPGIGRRAPRGFWADVPYLDPGRGDHKVIWELNRHQHWLALGRAWWLTGDRRYRDAFIDRASRAGCARTRRCIGVNWASMLELALRSLSWMWALSALRRRRRSTTASAPWIVDLLVALDRAARRTSSAICRGTSARTRTCSARRSRSTSAAHVLPELRATRAGGQRVGASVLVERDRPPGARRRRPRRALGALPPLLARLLPARARRRPTRSGDEARRRRSRRSAQRLARPAAASPTTAAACRSSATTTAGSCSRSPAAPPDDARPTLAWAAALLGRPDLRVGPAPEEAIWLPLPQPAVPRSRRRRRAGGARPPHRRCLARDGLRMRGRAAAIHLVFDAGAHGFLNGGHAHADALSVVLTRPRRPLLIDPGTGTYTMDPELRDRFRSSPLHNTLTLDGRSQSEPRGPFHWAHATAGAALRPLADQRRLRLFRGGPRRLRAAMPRRDGAVRVGRHAG